MPKPTPTHSQLGCQVRGHLTRSWRAWTFLALGEARQFAGNTGYDDRLVRYYSFDSTVPNHAQVHISDLAVLRNSEQALGMGWIDSLELKAAQKARLRCPRCGTTSFYARTERRPRFRCHGAHEFNQPLEEHISITAYRVQYEKTWQRFSKPLSVADLTNCYLGQSQQHAIRELKPGAFEAVLKEHHISIPKRWWEVGPI
jgi:ribosomal protein S27AE